MFGRSKNRAVETQDLVSLLRASLQGNTRAFEAVVGQYQSLVCAITYSGTRNVERSEELAQETFLKAWKSLDQLQDLAKFRAWLCSIARSTVQNWFRSQRQDVVGKAAPLDSAIEKASEEAGPEEAAMRNEQQAVVARALAQIPESLREPLILFYREQKSVREVAGQLALSENAARQRISRGRNMLREQVADIVETTITRTRPGKAFTTAVIAAVVASAAKTTTTAVAAAGIAAVVTGSSGTSTILSGLAAKAVALAAGVVIVAGGVVAYRQWTKPGQSPSIDSQSPVVSSANRAPQPGVNASGVDGLPSAVPAANQQAAAGDRDSAMRTPDSEPATPLAERGRSMGATATTQARPYEFMPKGVLSGRITDIDTGEPVRDAMVQITMSLISYARTDANGFYSFDKVDEGGSFQVAVYSREYVGIARDERTAAVYLSNDKQAVKHFQLPKACMVDVWVTDPNGAPVPKANVIVTSLADDRSREVGDSARLHQTDPNGYILLGGIPPARTDYLITVWRTAEQKSKDGRRESDFAPVGMTIQLTDPNVVKQIQIALQEGQEVHGYAQYADGVPASDIEVSASPTWWHCNYSIPDTPVNADGTFTLKHITPGMYSIGMYVPRPDRLGGTLSTVFQAQLPPEDGQPLAVKIPGKSPQSLVSIRGRLIFIGEKKPENVTIAATSSSGGTVYVDVPRKPNYELDDTFVVDRLEPGTYMLRFSGSNMDMKTVKDVVAPSEGLEVELVYAAKPRLTGTVVDSKTGEPIRSFRLRARKLKTLRGSNYVQPDRWTHLESERGFFSVDTVGPGVYQVQAVADGYGPLWSEEINTDRPGQTTIVLSPGGTIAGTVVNSQGEPIDGAKVIPLSLAGGAMPETKDVFVCEEGAATTTTGAFTLKNLPSGVETLKVTHADYAFTIVDNVPVVEGKTTDAVRITLAVGGTVEGYVYDEQGKPHAAQPLYFRNDSGYGGSEEETAGQLGSAVTDSNGFYRVSHLPEALCYVTRGSAWTGSGVMRRIVMPKSGDVTRLDFGGTPVVSGAALIEGTPLAKTRLMLGAADSIYFGSFWCSAMTSDQGAFAFPGVARGTHAIYMEQRDKRNSWLKIATVTVGDTDVEVGTIPRDASSLMLIINVPDADPAWQIKEVYLSDSDRPGAAIFRTAEAPMAAGEPWRVGSIGPGDYVLTVTRQDDLRWRTKIELGAGQSPWQIALTAPQGSARVSGRIHGDTNWLALWREGKDVWSLILARDGEPFSISDLPAGKYFIGNDPAFLYGLPALTEFTLGEAENKVIDVAAKAEPKERKSFLLVLVVDEKMTPRNDVHVWLEGPQGAVEPLDWLLSGYSFTTVPGQYMLHVEAAGYKPTRTGITLRPFGAAGNKAQTTMVSLQR